MNRLETITISYNLDNYFTPTQRANITVNSPEMARECADLVIKANPTIAIVSYMYAGDMWFWGAQENDYSPSKPGDTKSSTQARTWKFNGHMSVLVGR